MMESLSPHDWQLISTALDGQLTDRERSDLDALLHKNPAAKTEMDSLLRTRAVLRAAPRHRAPRNFTLTPAMVPQKSRFSGFRLVPALSLASVTSFVLFLAMLFSRPFLLGAPAAQAPMLASAENASDSASIEATAPIIIYNAAPQGYGVGGGYGGGGDGNDAAGTSGFTIITPEPTLPGPMEPTPEGPAALKSLTPAPTEEPVSESARGYEKPAQSTGPILGIRPTEEMGIVNLDEAMSTAEPSAPENGNLVSVLQWVFAAAWILSGVTAFVLWRKRL